MAVERKFVFISYANEAMAFSLRRIGRQARRLGIFDEVILYTPSDVPDYGGGPDRERKRFPEGKL